MSFDGNLWIAATQSNRKAFDPPISLTEYGSRHVVERGANLFPMLLRPQGQMSLLDPEKGSEEPQPNLSVRAWEYLRSVQDRPLTPNSGGTGQGREGQSGEGQSETAVAPSPSGSPLTPPELGFSGVGDGGRSSDLFYHALAILHAPAYRTENGGALRQDWPRIPLPDTLEALRASAALGRQVAALLDTEAAVPGVTSGAVRAELRTVGSIARVGGGALRPDEGDLKVTAGWGHGGQGGVTMPGKGRSVERAYTAEEAAALGDGLALLGETTRDVYLNGTAYWKNVPARVWEYTVGGYQVMKKWLSYREAALLGRDLTPEEAREVTAMARRIASLLLLESGLDANYQAVKMGIAPRPPILGGMMRTH